MALKRRAFLQQVSLALAALGLSEAGLTLLGDRYQQVLAQPTRRKLALLVGINQYSESVCDYVPPRGFALNGCLTDVELQQELLIHRFGFQPSDILLLTDQTATRQSIEAAFMTHLVQQAAPGDVVVFHFSGLGSQVRLEQAEPQTSLVPIDGTLPTAENPVIHDLMQETLGLLLRAVPTEQIITVLDVGFASLGRTAQGNLRIRSRPDVPIGSLDSAELAFQEQLTAQIRTAATKTNRRQSDKLPGTLLQASTNHQVATEAQWNGFSAGLFTYALTQQLWCSTPATALWVSFSRATGTVKQFAGVEQQPAVKGQTAAKQVLSDAIFTGADGVIRAVEDDGRAYLWLAGLPVVVLENSNASLFSIVSAASSKALVQLRGHDGLTVRARGLTVEATANLKAGQLVQEAVRMLLRNVGLTVAIDNSLERIERVDATSAFASIPRVSSVIAGEQSADLLFGKTQAAPLVAASLSSQVSSSESEIVQDAGSEELPNSKSGYGLFYPGRDAIPNTLIQNPEAVKTAVNRLTPHLKTLLAVKLLRLTQNQGSSRLGVRAALETVAPQERLVLQQETVRAPRTSPPSKVTSLLAEGSPTLLIGSQIQYRLHNYSSYPVYFTLLSLDTKGNAAIFHPAEVHALSAPASRTVPALAPGETVIVPETNPSGWLLQGPVGLAETHLVFSRAPFTQTNQMLETEMRSQTDAQQMMTLLNPLETLQAILQDLHEASSTILPVTEVPADTYALDVNAWATLSFVYQVVES